MGTGGQWALGNSGNRKIGKVGARDTTSVRTSERIIIWRDSTIIYGSTETNEGLTNVRMYSDLACGIGVDKDARNRMMVGAEVQRSDSALRAVRQCKRPQLIKFTVGV